MVVHPTNIDQLVYQLKTFKAFATNDGDPITQASAIRMDTSIIEKHGLFSPDLKEWFDGNIIAMYMATNEPSFITTIQIAFAFTVSVVYSIIPDNKVSNMIPVVF